MEELIALINELKVVTANWNLKCKRRFKFQSVTLPEHISVLVERIEVLIDELLITSRGTTDITNEILLEDHAGVEILTLESDSFGPLRKGIRIGRGLFVYG